MKAFALVLLCALAAVQGRHTGLESTRSAPALGEYPWVVHLRIAVSTSGLLNTCVGSLIDNRWVLTAASCIAESRFIWVRYAALEVTKPALVTENSIFRLHPEYNSATGENNVAVISINRDVHTTDYISPIGFGDEVGASGTFCGYGGDDAPGEQLNCLAVEVAQEDGALSVTGDFEVSKYDIGAPLVSNGAQVGLLVDEAGNFLATAEYVDWIEQETGVNFGAEAAAEVAPESVHFV